MPHTSGSLYNDPIWGHQGRNQQFGGGSSGGGSVALKGSMLANPWLQAGVQGGGALLQSLFGNREGKRHEKWQNEQTRRLMELFGGQLGSGPVIGPQQTQLLTSQFQEGQQPLLDKLGFQATRQAGLSSPESQRLRMETQLPVMARFQTALGLENIRLTQQEESELRRLMTMLARG